MENLGIDKTFWKNRKVLITGHTGFKGGWLSLWLQHMGAEVVGLSLDPPTNPSLFLQAELAYGMKSLHADIRDNALMQRKFDEYKPEILFHLAAQPLVRLSYEAPVETWETNVMGTLHVLEAARTAASVRAAVIVTSDKCYENREWIWGYRENDPMGGHDPYSSSKGAAELLVSSYRRSYSPDDTGEGPGMAIASARAGNVIGGGDWADDRLIPDIVRALKAGEEMCVRYPGAVRPWQHVLDPLSGYLVLAQELHAKGNAFAGGWNFGPGAADAMPVRWMIQQVMEMWGADGAWVLDNKKNPHEAGYLKLDCSKAHEKLAWRPRWNVTQALKKTVEWYKAEALGVKDLRALCLAQIESYMVQEGT